MKQVAQIALQQIGGVGRLSAMIGASNFSFDSENGTLQFHFKSCKKANIIKIFLNGSDLYDLEFFKYNRRTLDVKKVKTFDDIYAEDLKPVIEKFTGLYLSL